MGDIVNLNKYRKTKQRQTQARQADINREKFGRNKAVTSAERLRQSRDEEALDGKKLDEGSDEA